MYSTEVEQVIPKYPMAPDPVTGSKMFSINKADCSVSYLGKDLLVPHRKDYYFWAFVRLGSNRHWIDMKPYQLKADTFYFTIPPQIHLKEEARPLTGTTVAFTEEFLALEENALLRQLPIIQNPDNGHQIDLTPADVVFIDDMLEKIYAENQTGQSWHNSMLVSYMRVLFIYLSRLYTAQFGGVHSASDRAVLKKFLSRVEDNYTEHHEVSAYADMLNISAGHLSEVVKAQSGKPAMAHIHERLMLEAKRRLFHTDLSIKEIAFSLGFEDASYFNRFFKRISGDTPANYRDTTREMYH